MVTGKGDRWSSVCWYRTQRQWEMGGKEEGGPYMVEGGLIENTMQCTAYSNNKTN